MTSLALYQTLTIARILPYIVSLSVSFHMRNSGSVVTGRDLWSWLRNIFGIAGRTFLFWQPSATYDVRRML